MYIPTGCVLRLLHSILLHNGKAPTFALISCEDSVLFVEFHFISVHFGAGLIFFSCAVQEFRVRRSRISSFKPLYPHCQLPTTSPTGPGLWKPFFLAELLWILPGPSADASALKSESGLPDTSWCPKTIFPAWRGPMSSPPPCYTPSPSPAKRWNWENEDTPSYLVSFINPPSAMVLAVQRKPTVTNIESIPALGWMLRGLKVVMPTDLRTSRNSQDWKKGDTFQDTESSKCLNPHRVSVCIYSFDPRCCTWK